MIYAGIGARATPLHILAEMTNLAANLELTGFTLRSGGAAGADSAFEAGVKDPRHAKIFLPWANFNRNTSALFDIHDDAYEMAASFHPAWHRCSPAACKFHARNCYQVMGYHLDTPADFILCWTPDGAMVGGTAQALRIAERFDIPVFNMGTQGWETAFNSWMRWFLDKPLDFNAEGENDAHIMETP